jgi:hypothetical protein
MPCVGFEPTIAVFERAKTVHASDREAIVKGLKRIYMHVNINQTINVLNTTRAC